MISNPATAIKTHTAQRGSDGRSLAPGVLGAARLKGLRPGCFGVLGGGGGGGGGSCDTPQCYGWFAERENP